ncbi:NAD(P)/FAD-dependent oxidoreductase [Atopomonas sediminilitoris]|uniref:NAD(P)/FAD-dependent oxidoreductase n=1 Tax=Atopomonas sediminilitoris TaxID=2919919 RepID=UPI001F4DC3CD|nr:NAD(P)/FAD-dependent oxidoreductase [Atopomonas sediminilitoris]MCJ8168383.1 NAD(P)/FAD-dependent oxidoreductase [Atopomonas sediminilitoris]
MHTVDTFIIGAGALGLACAAKLAQPARSLLIAEQATHIGAHTSSRNSEVIHAGLYYPPDSLKAQACIEGRERLYHWCAAHHVPFQRIGKLLVAVDQAEHAALARLHHNAERSGVHDLEPLNQAQLHSLEPALKGAAALLSPSTGIIDSHAYLQSLLAAAQRSGADLALATVVEALHHDGQYWHIHGHSSGEPFSLCAERVINAAGLWASNVATRIEGLSAEHIPSQHNCRGHYFSYSGRSPFSRLIYPMPEANSAGLGIHATLDLGGQLRFGPDVDWHVAPSSLGSEPDYRFDEQRRAAFAQAIRRYFPTLDSQRLQPAYCGIRPKLSGPEQAAADFFVQGPREHGLPALVNLYGIESPGLTASLALAERVAALLT